MTTNPSSLHDLDALVHEWLTLPDVAGLLDIPVTRVHRLIDQGDLVDVRRGPHNARHVPAGLIKDGQIAPHVSGTLHVLRDQGFDAHESIAWLFTADPSLPGTPLEALRRGERAEVRRRAQALGF